MSLWQWVLLYLIVHCIVCVVLYLLTRVHLFKVSTQVFPLVLFVPLWGVIMFFCADFATRRQNNGARPIELHQFKFEDTDYRKMHIYADDETGAVVPLEEAILINNPAIKRKFMIDIISGGSGDYISLLQKARFDDDSDVAHYASTAIMETQRAYELQLQSIRLNCQKNPDDVSCFEKLADVTHQYIVSGLIEDSILIIQRKRYAEALNDIYRLYQSTPPQKYFCEMIDNRIELGEKAETLDLINRALQLWPDSETVWKLKIKYYYSVEDGEKIQQTVDEIKRAKIFLSQEMRESMSFWSEKGGV